MTEPDAAGQPSDQRLADADIRLIQRGHCLLTDWRHPKMSDPFWRWYWQDRPGAFVRTNDQEIALRPDRVYLVPPDTLLATDVRSPTVQLFLHFKVGLRLRDTHRRVHARTPTPAEWLLIKRLYRLMDRKAAGVEADFLTQGLIALCMADMPAAGWESPKVDPDIARVLDYMRGQYASPLDNATLMKVATLSGNTFLRRFREATGTTPHRYLCRLRVDAAAIDLQTSCVSMDQIAFRNGFCDRFHFARAFQKACGISPALYRKLGDRRTAGLGDRHRRPHA